jgi:hypothetical protein
MASLRVLARARAFLPPPPPLSRGLAGGRGGFSGYPGGGGGSFFASLPRERGVANFGFVIVPQQKAYVIERLGKYQRTLEASGRRWPCARAAAAV